MRSAASTGSARCHASSVLKLPKKAPSASKTDRSSVSSRSFSSALSPSNARPCKTRPGNFPEQLGRRLPRICVFACQLCLPMAGALVPLVLNVAGVVDLVRPRRVHAGVSRSQIMKVGVCRAALVYSVAVRPEVLAVPAARCSEVGNRFRAAAVDKDNAVRLIWICVEPGQRIRRVGVLAAVPDDSVVIDDVVECRLELGACLVGGCRVVVLRWIGLGRADQCDRASS